MYIEKCLSTPGYNSTFYTVKVPSVGKFRRGMSTQLFGIGDQKLVFLDEKTREVTAIYTLKDVVSIRHSPHDSCIIVISIRNGSKIQVQVDKERCVWLYIFTVMCVIFALFLLVLPVKLKW